MDIDEKICWNCEDRSSVIEVDKKPFCCSDCAHEYFLAGAIGKSNTKKDSINPSHYKSHPSGIECIQITEHMGFTLGNAMKYIWRADLKHDDGGVEDLKKAQWYIERELQKRSNLSA